MSASKDGQEAFEAAWGGALRWVSLVRVVFLVHDLIRATKFTGVHRMRGATRWCLNVQGAAPGCAVCALIASLTGA